MTKKITRITFGLALLVAVMAAQWPPLPWGNLGVRTNGLINFGTVTGSAGYGIRDYAGTLQVKNSGGSWANINSGYTDSTIRALFSSSATGLTYTNTTGVFSLTSGYAIPTTTVLGYLNQDVKSSASPTFVGATLSGLTASLPVVTDGSKALASMAYATFKANLSLAQADISGLTTASSPTFAGITVSGLTSGRIPIAGTAGLLGDDADLTFSGDTLTATKVVGSTSVTTPLATIGSATAGGSVTVNSKETELITSPMVTGGWTLGFDTGGWSITAGVLSKTASTGTQTATAVSGMTAAPVAGTKYLVTAVVSAASGTTTWTLGGAAIPSFSAAATYTYVVTAGTTAKLVLSGVAASTCEITSLSVKEIETTSGNATVENDLTVGRVLARMGNAGAPSISNSSDTDTGIYWDGSNTLSVTTAGTQRAQFATAGIVLTATTGAVLWRNGGSYLYSDASYFLDQRNSTNQSGFRLYNTYTDTSNYERLTLTGVAGASVNITAETAGTGGDNLDIVLTPAGTGNVKTTKGYNSTIYSGSLAADAVGSTGLTGLYGLIVVKDTTTGATALIRIENATIAFISAAASFNAAKDNAATVNIYYETDQVKIQNKTAGTIAVAAGFYGL